MIDQGSFYLQKIADIATPDRGGFKIQRYENYPDQYAIIVGDICYVIAAFTPENLMNAHIAILASLMKKEGWV